MGIDAASEGGIAWALLAVRAMTVPVVVVAIVLTRPAAIGHRDVPVVAMVGALALGADALFAAATTHGLLSVVAVLGSLYPIVTIALASVYLGERLGRTQQLGAALCLGGVVALAAG